jgi:hypothetical protein
MSTLIIRKGKKVWKTKTKKIHREDGPAIEWEDGTKEWYIYGKLHREDSPAIEYANGYNNWCICGRFVSKTEFTDLLVQHHLKLQLLSHVIPIGAETLVDQYAM